MSVSLRGRRVALALWNRHTFAGSKVPDDYLHGALRLSLGRSTSAEDIDYVLAILPRIVEQARAMAPTFTP